MFAVQKYDSCIRMEKKGSLAKRLSKDKPWAKLRVSRKRYMSSKPWKSAGMTKGEFEELLQVAPDDMICELWDEAHADNLLKALGFDDLGVEDQ